MYKYARKMIILLLIFLVLIQSGVLAQESRYILGPDDVLEVIVWDNPDLSKIITIRSDGYISLPLIGDIKAEGLTPEALANRVKDLLKEYIVSPKVTVAVNEFKMLNVSVVGAAVKQGTYPVKPGTRLLEVLAMAGVLEKQAELEEVTLTRNEVIITINLDKLLREGGHQNYLLQSGDVIYIPYTNRVVYILGEVKNPGSYPLDKMTTPADVLAMAGGPNDRADLKSVKIIRRDGNKETEIVNLEKFLDNKAPDSITYLEDGDIVQVAETNSINWEKIFTYAAGIKIIHDLIVNW